jgi:ATP-dependent helicase/nuclease subunit B
MINEFKACGVSPSGLEATASKLSSDAPLAKKLRDFALIYSSFDALISENYSDSADDLSRLWKALKDHDFFNGCNVYIDSFTSFTSVEHRIIDRIFASAANVTITIPLPHPKHSDISTAGIEESLKRLKLSAKKSEVTMEYIR